VDWATALVATANLQLRIETIRRHPELLKDINMTPTFKGLGSALVKLKHDLDLQAGPLMADIESLASDSPALLKQAAAEVAKTKQAVADIKDFVAGLVGSNGGDPLDDSSAPSAPTPSAPTPPAVPPADRTVVAS
jgi:hypothetical protein